MQLRCGHARAPVDRARSVHAWLRAALLACVFASLPLPALASAIQAKAGAEPSGEAPVGEVLRDPDFGVTTRQAGLQRHLELYPSTRHGSGSALEWTDARVGSRGFAPAPENPPQTP